MITLEILIENSASQICAEKVSLGFEVGHDMVSDRMPSIWQNWISDQKGGVLLHLFDRTFSDQKTSRWLYEDVDSDDQWKRFFFKSELEVDFFDLIQICLEHSGSGQVWLMCDAQFGPSPLTYSGKTFEQFKDLYRRFGIRINSAMPIYC